MLKNKAVMQPMHAVENPDKPRNGLCSFAHILWIRLCARRTLLSYPIDLYDYFYAAQNSGKPCHGHFSGEFRRCARVLHIFCG